MMFFTAYYNYNHCADINSVLFSTTVSPIYFFLLLFFVFFSFLQNKKAVDSDSQDFREDSWCPGSFFSEKLCGAPCTCVFVM